MRRNVFWRCVSAKPEERWTCDEQVLFIRRVESSIQVNFLLSLRTFNHSLAPSRSLHPFEPKLQPFWRRTRKECSSSHPFLEIMLAPKLSTVCKVNVSNLRSQRDSIQDALEEQEQSKKLICTLFTTIHGERQRAVAAILNAVSRLHTRRVSLGNGKCSFPSPPPAFPNARSRKLRLHFHRTSISVHGEEVDAQIRYPYPRLCLGEATWKVRRLFPRRLTSSSFLSAMHRIIRGVRTDGRQAAAASYVRYIRRACRMPYG